MVDDTKTYGKCGSLAMLCTSGSWGGLELNTLRLALKLRERGRSVVMLCAQSTPLHEASLSAGMSVVTIRPPWKYGDVLSALHIRRLLKHHACTDMIFTYGRDTSVAARIARSSSVIVVYQQHMGIGVDKRDVLHTRRYRSLDAWIAPLPSLREEVLRRTRMHHDKVYCIPLGADVQALGASRTKDEARDMLGVPGEGRYVGVIGRVDPAKGQEVVLRAMHRHLHDMKDVSLLIMGEPSKDNASYGEHILTVVNAFGLQQKVFMRPFMEQPRVFFDAVDLCIVPTRSETYGMVTVEALLCACPVAGTRAGGTPEILMQGAWGDLFEADNDLDCARVIRNALDDMEGYRARAQSIQAEAVERFSFDSECEQIEQLLRTLRS